MDIDDNAAREQLAGLIKAHNGNSAAIARALSADGMKISRQAVSQRIHKYGLENEADILRADAGVKGQRYTLKDGVVDAHGERDNLIRELQTGPDRDAVAKRLGISRRNLFRKMERYGITKDVLERARPRRKSRRKGT